MCVCMYVYVCITSFIFTFVLLFYVELFYIISECRKLPLKEYKNRHDWVGKVIHWELCKKLKFDYTDQ